MTVNEMKKNTNTNYSNNFQSEYEQISYKKEMEIVTQFKYLILKFTSCINFYNKKACGLWATPIVPKINSMKKKKKIKNRKGHGFQ